MRQGAGHGTLDRGLWTVYVVQDSVEVVLRAKRGAKSGGILGFRRSQASETSSVHDHGMVRPLSSLLGACPGIHCGYSSSDSAPDCPARGVVPRLSRPRSVNKRPSAPLVDSAGRPAS